MRGVLIRLIDEELNRVAIALHEVEPMLVAFESNRSAENQNKLKDLSARFAAPTASDRLTLLPALGQSDSFKIASVLMETTRLRRALLRLAEAPSPGELEARIYFHNVREYTQNLDRHLRDLTWIKNGELQR